MIDYGFRDSLGRSITLCPVDREYWRAVADVAPLDDQRGYVPALAARYLLLSTYEEVWHSLAVCADGTVVGHVMWGLDPTARTGWAACSSTGPSRAGVSAGRSYGP